MAKKVVGKRNRRGEQCLPLTEKYAKDTINLLKQGKDIFEVYTTLDVTYQTFYSWIIESLFGPPEKRTPEQRIIREGLLDSIFREIVLEKILKVIADPQEKVIEKRTTLHSLSKAEQGSLEKMGYEGFLTQFEEDGITLKVERTTEIIPIPVGLLERLIKLVESDTSIDEIAHKLMSFNPVDPVTPGV